MEKNIEESTKSEIKELDVQLEEQIKDEVMTQIDKGKREINEFFELQELHVKRQTTKLATRCMFNMKKQILNQMIDHVVDLKFEAQKRLGKCDHNEFKDIYLKILCSLLLQGLILLSERNVIVKVRERDTALMRGVLRAVQHVYKDFTGHCVDLKLDRKHYLTEAGVSLETKDVSLSNTLQARLDRIVSANIPAIRHNLFGSNYKSRPVKKIIKFLS